MLKCIRSCRHSPQPNVATHLRLVQRKPACLHYSTISAKKDAYLDSVSSLWGSSKWPTFLALDFEWWEADSRVILECGYAALKSAELLRQHRWPPEPRTDYITGHYIILECVNSLINKWCPTYPWDYAFGTSALLQHGKLKDELQRVIGALTDDGKLDLVFMGHGLSGDTTRLADLKIMLPPKTAMLDTQTYEHRLFTSGLRGPMTTPSNPLEPRIKKRTFSLQDTLLSLGDIECDSRSQALNAESRGANAHLRDAFQGRPREIDPWVSLHTLVKAPAPRTPRSPHDFNGYRLHNAGNDAFLTLYAFQRLVDRKRVPKL